MGDVPGGAVDSELGQPDAVVAVTRLRTGGGGGGVGGGGGGGR